MAGNGPPPKDGGKHGNFVSELEQPLATFTAGGPVEPPRLPRYREYSALTKHWWDRWTRSPMAATFCETDWSRLIQLAPLVEIYHRLTDFVTVDPDMVEFG